MFRASLLTLALVAFPPTNAFAQTGSPRVEARGTQAAARCLERFARGETPPPARRPARRSRARTQEERIIAALTSPTPSGPAADAREGLRQCLARAIPFPSRLAPHQAGWLAPCLEGAALALRSARRPEQRARARFQVDACRTIGDAMSRWDPDVSGLWSGRSRVHPEVYVASVGPMGELTRGERQIAEALDAAAGSIAACRATHGNGVVRAAVRSGARWEVVAWPVEGPDALAHCVEDAVRGAALLEGPAETIAVDVSLADPRPVVQAPLGLLGAPMSAGLGVGSNPGSAPHRNGIDASCESRIERLGERLGPPAAVPSLIIRELGVPELDSGAPITGAGAVINIYPSDFPVIVDDENTLADGAAAGAVIARSVPRDRSLYVAAHADVLASRLLAILGPLRDRGVVRLIVRLRASASAEHASLHTDIASAATEITEAIGTCGEGMAVMRRLGGRLPLRRANLLREQLPPALRRCGCRGVDVERLGSLLEPVVADEPDLRALPFTLASPSSPGIRLPSGATVSDLARAAASVPSDRPATFSL